VDSERAINTSSLNISISTPIKSFKTTLWDYLKETAEDTGALCQNAVVYEIREGEEIKMTFNPNLTLIRKTTDITIGAY